MKIHPTVLAVVLAGSTALTLIVPARAAAQDGKPAKDADAAYTRVITARSAKIVATLGLTDAAKSNRVQNVLVARYRFLNAWHEKHDAELKALKKAGYSPDKESAARAKEETAKIQATMKPSHDEFLARLAEDLTPEQVEAVKDGMTYRKVQFTYTGYRNLVPDMTKEEQAHVLALLKEARELAIDGGSSEEKSAIFNKYKGKINNYLSARGHDTSGKRKPKPAAEKTSQSK